MSAAATDSPAAPSPTPGLGRPGDMPDVNARGIPRAPFVENADVFMEGKSVEQTLAGMNEMYHKYKMMEESLASQKERVKGRIPEIQNSVDAVLALQTQKDAENDEPLGIDFELADNVFVEASIPRERMTSVGVWLGASTMVEFPLGEALDLLKKNLGTAQAQLRGLDEDLSFLKDQITTSEVNIARLYNWDVKKRREQKASGTQ